MAQEERAQASAQTHVNTALVRGRIVGKPRKYTTRDGERFVATLVRLPAADEFSSAPTVEIHSPNEGIGEEGETFAGRVRLSGSVRSFEYTDRVTGDRRKGVDCTVRLELVK